MCILRSKEKIYSPIDFYLFDTFRPLIKLIVVGLTLIKTFAGNTAEYYATKACEAHESTQRSTITHTLFGLC